MDYIVRVKAGHPSGVRRRGGLTFTSEGTRLSSEQLTRAICEDPWLEGMAVEEPEAPVMHPPPAGGATLLEEERAGSTEFADKLHEVSDAIFPAAGESSAAAEGAADQKPASNEAAASDGKNGDGHEGRKKRKH